MARYIKAVECADIISEKFNIPLGDLVDVFAEIPTAEVVPKSEVAREIFEEMGQIKKEYANGDIDGNELYVRLYLLEKKYTEGKR